MLFLNKKYLLIILVVILVLVASYFIYVSNKKTNPIIKQIENFSLYQEITDPAQRSFDKTCPNEEFNIFLKLTESGSMKSFSLPGGMVVVITPNYYKWDNKKFLGFKNAEPPAFCNAGIMGPVHAYKDYLLWAGACSTGRMPESKDPDYVEFVKCTETEEIINNYFQ
jgi:hypothetical protein